MSLTPVSRFWSLLRPFRVEIRQIHFYALLIGLVNLSLPLGIQAIITFLQTGNISTGWIVLVGFVLAGIAITGFLQVLQLRLVEDIQQHIFVRSAFDFAYRLPRIQTAALDDMHAPELVNRFFDTMTIQKGLPKILIDFSLSFFQVLFGLILLAIYSPVFILAGVFFVALLWVIFTVTGPIGLRTSLRESGHKYKIAYWLEELARTQESFKFHAGPGMHMQHADAIAEKYLDARESHFQVLIRQAKFFIGYKVIVAATLLLLGGVLVFREQMNIGQFVAAEIIIILIINSIEKLIRVSETIFDVLTALEKIGYVTDLELDSREGVPPPPSPAGWSIQADRLSFGYPDQPRAIMRDVSFQVPARGKVVVEGDSGTGKSTLLRLIAGIYEPTGGDLMIHHQPVVRYRKEDLLARIGYYYPSLQLFDGTLRDNIVMGRPIGDDRVMEILTVVGLDDFLSYQPAGLQVRIDPGGRRLRRSVIQKILLARTLVGNPDLLLLEDPGQFLEMGDRHRLIKYIMDPGKTWTVVVVAEDPLWLEMSTGTIKLSGGSVPPSAIPVHP